MFKNMYVMVYLCQMMQNGDRKMRTIIKCDGDSPLVPLFLIPRQILFKSHQILKVITCKNMKFRNLTESNIFLSVWFWRSLQIFLC